MCRMTTFKFRIIELDLDVAQRLVRCKSMTLDHMIKDHGDEKRVYEKSYRALSFEC
jgi:hypothetical protein